MSINGVQFNYNILRKKGEYVMEIKFNSPTYGKVNFEQMIEIMHKFYLRNKDYGDFNVIVGTDSQNFSDTKMVSYHKNCFCSSF